LYLYVFKIVEYIFIVNVDDFCPVTFCDHPEGVCRIIHQKPVIGNGDKHGEKVSHTGVIAPYDYIVVYMVPTEADALFDTSDSQCGRIEPEGDKSNKIAFLLRPAYEVSV
jgi:hypothetical protein